MKVVNKVKVSLGGTSREDAVSSWGAPVVGGPRMRMPTPTYSVLLAQLVAGDMPLCAFTSRINDLLDAKKTPFSGARPRLRP